MFTHHFLQIPPPIDWSTSQVANIIALFGTIGTIGTLLYLIIQDKRKSKQINDLAEITKQLADQNKLILEQVGMQKVAMKYAVKPDLHAVSGITTDSTEIDLTIVNKAKNARIINIDYDEEFVTFKKRLTPFLLRKEDSIVMRFKYNNKKPWQESTWALTLEYDDVYGNKYLMSIYGLGPSVIKSSYVELGDVIHTHENMTPRISRFQ